MPNGLVVLVVLLRCVVVLVVDGACLVMRCLPVSSGGCCFARFDS
jgi:hypothetical protein